MENIEKLDGSPEFNPQWYNSFISCSNEKETIVSKVAELISDNGGTCLEIGLGTRPIFAERMADRFKKYVIVEKEDFNNLKLEENIQLIKEDWESVKLNQKFDVILASHIIYYFKDKQGALNKMLAHLNVGGKLIIIVNGKEENYGPTKSFFAEKIGKNYEFTYDQVLNLLKDKKINEYNIPTEVTFENLESLHSSVKLIFDNYPREYEIFKDELLKYWDENLKENKFIINQKIIEVINDKYIEDSLGVLEESQKETGKYEIDVNGRKFVVYPNVFSPKYFSDTKIFCEVLPIRQGEKVLEIGCGTGILSIFAALSGAETIYATDISPSAVDNAKENAEMHGFSDKIKVTVGDVYESIPKDLKFDTIIWNGPFLYIEKENISMLERSILDRRYESLRKTIDGARHYLNEDGKLVIGFSTSIGRLDLLNKFLKDAGFESKIIFSMQAPLGNSDVFGKEYDKINFELFEARRIR